MKPHDEEPQSVLIKPKLTPSQLLDQLLDILINPTEESNAFYEAAAQRAWKSTSPITLVYKVIRTGVEAEMSKQLIVKVINAIIKADNITTPSETILKWINEGYAEAFKSKVNNERRIKGLPPLPWKRIM